MTRKLDPPTTKHATSYNSSQQFFLSKKLLLFFTIVITKDRSMMQYTHYKKYCNFQLSNLQFSEVKENVCFDVHHKVDILAVSNGHPCDSCRKNCKTKQVFEYPAQDVKELACTVEWRRKYNKTLFRLRHQIYGCYKRRE